MKINKHHGLYNVQRRVLAVKYIVVHYVGAGTSVAGNALNNCKYFAGGNRQASAHYFIDDGGIWEYADPEAYATWHCGDGGGKYGITNANSIGIEVCMNGDKPFTAREITFLKELVMYLMKKFGVPAGNVVRHYDASRKLCPYYYAKRAGEWEALRKTITGASTVSSKPAAQSASKPAGTTSSAAKSEKIAVDGSWGKATTRLSQKVLGTSVDGIVSNQPVVNKQYLPNCSTTSWQFKSSGYSGGSSMVKALQRRVGATADGYCGKGTVTKLQKYLGISTDGSCGPATVKAWQRYLNSKVK